MRNPIPLHLLCFRCLLLTSAIAGSPVRGEDGDPDPAFGDGGRAVHAWPAGETLQAETTAGATAPDGSVIAGGWISHSAGQQHYAVTLLRWRADGTPDPGFGDDGVARIDLDPTAHIRETLVAVVPQPGGKLLAVAGIQLPDQMAYRPVLLSMRADGTPDEAFGPGGMRPIDTAPWDALGDVQIRATAAQPDGKIVLAGILVTGDGYHVLVGRVLPDASPDAGFGFQGYRTVSFDLVDAGYDSLMGIFPLADGKLMLLGRAEIADEITAAAPPAMVRLTAAGNVDTAFAANGRRVFATSPWPAARFYYRGVARQPDGKFLFGGYCLNCSGTYSAVVLRADASGEPDASFGTAGWSLVPAPTNPALASLHVDARGRIVLAGSTVGGGERQVLVARLTADGQADTSFGADGNGASVLALPDHTAAEWNVTSVASERDGSLYLGVSNYVPIDGGSRGGVARLHADGSLDTAYGTGGLRELTREQGSRIEAIARRSDGRLVAAGSIDHTGGSRDFYVARLLPDGTLDHDFDGNGIARYEISPQQDDGLALALSAGMPVIAGHTYAPDATAAVLRLESDLLFADGLD